MRSFGILKVALAGLFPHGSGRARCHALTGLVPVFLSGVSQLIHSGGQAPYPAGASSFRKTAVGKPSMVNLPLFSAYQAWAVVAGSHMTGKFVEEPCQHMRLGR